MQSWMGKFVFTLGLAGVAWLVLDSSTAVHSQTGKSSADSNKLEIVSTMLPTGNQQVVVLDTERQTMAVYHIEPAQGKIQLKSVRSLAWDLQMEQFNGQSPLPSELRQVQP